ncbi:uncharacterized protein LOC113146658 [Cyclospora cayetanensis]|uniref:Uncharacterized protein LOC113146658 n=1 Tax=Cyclospora cayetanensis TaxID=88456 RepID=A0A6P6RRM5_9EIME|nr:uncharacterized protein LOC113146658 [Cyclospora cayetanensis]
MSQKGSLEDPFAPERSSTSDVPFTPQALMFKKLGTQKAVYEALYNELRAGEHPLKTGVALKHHGTYDPTLHSSGGMNLCLDGPYSTGIFALQQPSWIGRCVTPSAVYSEGLTGSSGGHLLTSITPHQWPVESRAQQRRRQKKAISRPQVLELSPGHMLQAGVPGGPVQKTASYKHYQQLEAPIEQQCAGGHYSRCCRSGFQRQPSYHDACNACTATHCLPRREHPMTENQYHILLQHLRDLAGQSGPSVLEKEPQQQQVSAVLQHQPNTLLSEEQLKEAVQLYLRGLATSTILQAQQHMQQQQMLQHQQLLQQLQVLQQQIHQQMPMQCKSAQEMLPQETQCGHLSGHVPQPQQRSGAPDCGFYAPSRRVESLLDAMQEDRQGPTKKSKHTFDPIVQQQGVVALRKNGGLHRVRAGIGLTKRTSGDTENFTTRDKPSSTAVVRGEEDASRGRSWRQMRLSRKKREPQ